MTLASGVLSRLALLCFCLARLLELWPWLLLAAFLISPIGPHLRIDPIAEMVGQGHRGCLYIGSRGLRPPAIAGCPLLLWMEARP